MFQWHYTHRHSPMPTDSWGRDKALATFHVLACGLVGSLIIGIPAYRVAPFWAPLLALIGFVGGVFGFIVWQKRRNARLAKKGASLQRQLHDLKQEEFELRYAEAKANGQLKDFREDRE